MLEVIGQVLPEVVVIALSPFAIAGLIAILLTRKAQTNSLMFLLGWLLGLTAIAVAVLALVEVGDRTAGDDAVDAGVQWGALAFGLALLFLAYRSWQKRPKAGQAAKTPAWMASIDALEPRGAAALGALLAAVNPKSLLLAVAAMLTIASAALSSAQTFVATSVFILLSSTTIIGSVIYFAVGGASAEATLQGAKGWLVQNNATIMMVILLIIGSKLVGQGLSVV